LFDKENKGYISKEDLTTMLYNAFSMEDVDVEELFLKVDSQGDNKITFGKY